MAGIEKICEFSEEYGSFDMYRYKHNSIQIMPKYRPLFKGCDAVLHIFVKEIDYDPIMYVLEVKDPELQGQVKGKYLNWSRNISTVKRKMRRLTGDYRLKIVNHDVTYSEWRKNNK